MRISWFRSNTSQSVRLVTTACMLLLTIGCLNTATYAQTKGRSRTIFADTPAGPQLMQLSGTCEIAAMPDIAIISGGVSSGALKPIEAAEQLDKQLAVIKTYLEETRGQLQLLERVRTLANPSSKSNERESPFQVVQRLHVQLSSDAPFDAILQRLIELGLDRFGDNVLDSSRRAAVISYRFGNFDDKMHDLQKHCVASAWKEWCAAPTSGGACPSEQPPATLQPQSFSVRSTERLLRADGGGAQYWQFTYAGAQRSAEPPELLGKIVVKFNGTIALTYRLEGKP